MRIDLLHRQPTKMWERVEFQRPRPLRCVFLVSPTWSMGLDVSGRGVLECDCLRIMKLCAKPLASAGVNWIDAIVFQFAQLHQLCACLCETEGGIWANSHVVLMATQHIAVNPRRGPRLTNAQIQPITGMIKARKLEP